MTCSPPGDPQAVEILNRVVFTLKKLTGLFEIVLARSGLILVLFVGLSAF